jgi:hypothetical protein
MQRTNVTGVGRADQVTSEGTAESCVTFGLHCSKTEGGMAMSIWVRYDLLQFDGLMHTLHQQGSIAKGHADYVRE